MNNYVYITFACANMYVITTGSTCICVCYSISVETHPAKNTHVEVEADPMALAFADDSLKWGRPRSEVDPKGLMMVGGFRDSLNGRHGTLMIMPPPWGYGLNTHNIRRLGEWGAVYYWDDHIICLNGDSYVVSHPYGQYLT